MQLWSRKTLKQELNKRDFHPSRGRGQTFMTDAHFLSWMVDESGAERGDLVLEIGTGPGHLTTVLLQKGCHVIGVEIEGTLAELCRNQTGNPETFTPFEGDALEDDRLHPDLQLTVRNRRKNLGTEDIYLVSNLPYQQGPKILIALLESRLPLHESSVVVLQKEQAEKLSTDPGDSRFGIPSVLFQWNGSMEIIRTLDPSVFWPEPDVTSVLCRVNPESSWVHVDVSRDLYEEMKKVVRILFRHPRKTLRNNIRLSDDYTVDDVELYGDFVDLFLKKRPEKLTPKEWYDLSRSLVRAKEKRELDDVDSFPEE